MQVEQRPDSQAGEPGPEAACGFRRAQALGCAGAAFIVSGVGSVLLLLRRRNPRHARHLGHWASRLGVLTVLVGATGLLAYLYDTPLLSILLIVAGMITAAVAARIALLIGSRFDESKRKLRGSEERRRAVLEAAMDGVWLADTQGRLLEVNDAYCRMSGYSARELLAMRIHDLEARDDVNAASAYIEEIMVRGERRFESRHRRKDGCVFDVEASARYQPSDGGRIVVFLRDITERKQVERYRDLGSRIVQILNEADPVQVSIQRVLSELKARTGFDAVGLRMQVGDDYPYFAQQGFPWSFLQTENTLIARDTSGGVCRSPQGDVRLECTCGQVLSGGFDPDSALFTAGGSFWTNDTFLLPDVEGGAQPPLHPRSACVHQGYASVALVPVRSKGKIVGLIQLNDRRKGCFTLGAVEKLEGIGEHIGETLVRRLAEDALAAEHQRRLLILESIGDGFFSLDRQWRVTYINERGARLLGRSRADLVGKILWESFPESETAPFRQAYELALADQVPAGVEAFFSPLEAWFKARAYPSPEGLSVFYQNTTERKAVLAENELLARFTEESPDAILRILEDGTLAYANPASFVLLSQLDGHVGMPAPETLRQPALAALARDLRQESEFVCADRVYTILCAPFPESGYANVYGRDVTEKRTAEKMVALAVERERGALSLSVGARAAVDTLNAIGDGVMLLDMDGCVLSINPAFEKMTGILRAEAFGQHVRAMLSTVLQPDEFNLADAALAKALQGKAAALPAVSLLNRSGGRTPTIPTLAFVRDACERPTAVVVTLRDVSGIQAVQKSLKESKERYRELVEHANSCIMRVTPDHTITFFNEYAQAFFGYRAEDVIGRNVLGTIVPETDSGGRDLRGLMRDITAHPELHAMSENENCCKDGRRVWLHWANRAVRDEQGRVVELLCVGTDITRRREMEKEALRYQRRLQELSEKLAASEEEDRWRISRYIHDTIIQNLSLSTIRLGSLAKPLAAAQLGEEVRTLRQVKELLNAAIDECRMVMSDLTPSLLYELGLVPALNELAQQVQEKHGRRMIVDDDGLERPMSHPLRGLLFACTREVIMNALKHAGLCEIRVSVSRRENGIVLQVSDDGKGFDPDVVSTHPERSGGFGLFSIRERMEGLGGRLELKSAPGKGTTATMAVPLLEGEGR
jgi:PAS domain S-box-containing protein